MKKLSLALAVTSALGASAANAAIVSEFGNAVLIPWVYHDSDGRTTSVGLTSCANGTVYWTFFDENSQHLFDNRFGITENQQSNFAWSDPAFGAPFEGQHGYMLLVLDTAGPLQANPTTGVMTPGPADGRLGGTDSACLTANAFYVDPPADDVSYIPAVPLNWAWRDFRLFGGTVADGLGRTNGLLELEENDVIGLWAGSKAGENLYMRYLKNDVVNDQEDTRIVIWSVGGGGLGGFSNPERTYECPTANGGIRDVRVSRHIVYQYGLDQVFSSSTNLELQYEELNIIDVEINGPSSACDAREAGLGGSILAVDTTVDDGFFLWPGIPADMLSFSIVRSDGFDATQTLINPSRVPFFADNNGRDGIRDVLDADGNVIDQEFVNERYNIFERYNPEGDNPYDGLGDAVGEGGDPEEILPPGVLPLP